MERKCWRSAVRQFELMFFKFLIWLDEEGWKRKLRGNYFMVRHPQIIHTQVVYRSLCVQEDLI